MKKHITIIVFIFISSFCIAQTHNSLTEAEKADGWKLLFNGQNLDGWAGLDLNKVKGGWEIKDGILTVMDGKSGNDIIATEKFTNFELQLDFKYEPGANSGIKYFIQPPSSIGFEYQILEDENNSDAVAGINRNHTQGSLYDLIPAENQTPKAAGEWNQVRIIVNNGHGEHWLNGVKVVEYERYSACFRQLIQFSKFKNEKDFGQHKSGHILLQDHGDTVSFRNIKIKELYNTPG